MDVTHEMTATLRAEAHHPPCIMGASGFCTEHSANSRGIGYEDERAPTLRAEVVPGVAIDFNPTDSRIRISEDGVCQTLCSRMGTGGNQVPLVFAFPLIRATPCFQTILTQESMRLKPAGRWIRRAAVPNATREVCSLLRLPKAPATAFRAP